MDITDSHAHASQQWFEPLETLLHQMDHNHVSSVVLIQINGEYDNSYNRQIVRDYPGRFACVAHLDAARPDAPDQLRHLADDGVSGLCLRPSTRSSGQGSACHLARRRGPRP
jgi:L-fuconolactonase